MSVRIEQNNGIYTLTIDRERAMNALNRDVMDGLFDFFISSSPEIGKDKGVIITGAGEKAFVAGADITEFKNLSDDQGRAMAERGHEIFNAIERYPVPVVAAVNGFALGGGCELAMACHLRVASEKARFGQPEVSLGLIPGYGGTQRLRRLIGRTKAMELLMTGAMISAIEAHQIGLVNYVVSPDHVIEKATELVRTISLKAPLAVKSIISILNKYDDEVVGMQSEIEHFGACFRTEDVTEGVDAFLNKRKPQFKGA